MGGSLNSGSSSGSGGGFSGSPFTNRSMPTTIAEINVTPLVDVMLVLLIVFMISAPLMQQGVQIDLPKTKTTAMNEVPDRLLLSVKGTKQIYISDHLIPAGTLQDKLQAIVAAKPQIEVVIHADQKLEYGFIAAVIAEVKQAGIHRVGLATEANVRSPQI